MRASASSCSSASPSRRAARACWRSRTSSREIDDEFTRKGLQLVVDGTDPELVREILENEIDGMARRHAPAAQPFEKAGGFAPTMGIIGTVMGLVHVLENLDAPATLGPAISGAFIATLLRRRLGQRRSSCPIGHRLKRVSRPRRELRSMTARGHPRHPGRRQPARRRRASCCRSSRRPSARPSDEPSAAAGPPATPAERRGGGGRVGHERARRKRAPRAGTPAAHDETRSAGCSPTPT